MADTRRSVDPASLKMLEIAEKEGHETAFDRFDAMQPQCGFGQLGICCRNCSMGPCRIDPFGEGPQAGICGANADTIAARNLIRMVAAGAAAHSDHGRDITHTLKLVADQKTEDYTVKDEKKLRQVAERFGIKTEGKDTKGIVSELADAALAEFGKQEGTLATAIAYAPPARVKVWEKLGVMPRSIDREIVEVMHRTHIGVYVDYRNLMKHAIRTSLSRYRRPTFGPRPSLPSTMTPTSTSTLWPSSGKPATPISAPIR